MSFTIPRSASQVRIIPIIGKAKARLRCHSPSGLVILYACTLTSMMIPSIRIMFTRQRRNCRKRFLYKKRFLQLRLCLVNIILMLGIIILVSVQAYNITKPDGEWHLNLAFAFPIIGIILTWLALRGIVKDIALLKSYDRIR